MNSELSAALLDKKVIAFLEMIRHSEGTAGPNGYRTMFGGRLFDSFNDHPGIFFDYKNKAGQMIKTSAAGAYQITHTTWVALKLKLGLPDFSAHWQDMGAVELLHECGALSLILSGQFTMAVEKARGTWASLPGSGNNQPEHTIAQVTAWYEAALA